jgi:hypothetical protein
LLFYGKHRERGRAWYIKYVASNAIIRYITNIQCFNLKIQFQEQTFEMGSDVQEHHLQHVYLQTISPLFSGAGLSHVQCC